VLKEMSILNPPPIQYRQPQSKLEGNEKYKISKLYLTPSSGPISVLEVRVYSREGPRWREGIIAVAAKGFLLSCDDR